MNFLILSLILILLVVFDMLYISIYTVIKTKNIKNIFNYEKGMKLLMDLVTKIQGKPSKLKSMPIFLLYIINTLVIHYFIIEKAKKENTTEVEAAKDAFLLGFAIYIIFGLSMYSMFDNYPLVNVVFDSLWGGITFYTITFIMLKYF
tara:strand:- start:1013 stop:1453 length:441 start_codon:yes stop_codon:yes gene_type:complete